MVSFRFKIELREEDIYRLVDWTGKSLRWALIMRSTKEIGTHVWNVHLYLKCENTRPPARSPRHRFSVCVCGLKIAEQLTYFQEFSYGTYKLCGTTKNEHEHEHEHVLKRNDSHSVTVIEKSECNWQMKTFTM